MTPLRRCFVALSFATVATNVLGQCGTEVLAGFAHQGPDGMPDALCWWDADGPGPFAPRLFVGGTFRTVERTPCQGAAIYDPSTRLWQVLPPGTFDRVHAAAVDGLGNLVVAGSIAAGVSTLHRVARWNGTTWTMLGGLFDAPVRTLLRSSSGAIVAGGEFTLHGGTPTAGLAEWNGSAWQPIGGGVGGGFAPRVDALCSLPNGDLVVGGTFGTAGGVPAANIARWNGTTWQALGAGRPPEVISIAAFANGDLFTASLGQFVPSRWNGVSWIDVTGIQPPFVGFGSTWIGALATAPSFSGEQLLVAGNFRIGAADLSLASVLDFGAGLVWSPLSVFVTGANFSAPTRCRMAVDFATGRVALAGPMVSAGGIDVSNVFTLWEAPGGEVDPLGNGIGASAVVTASSTLPNGDLVIGGGFRSIGRTASPGVARSANGVDWEVPLISGVLPLNGNDVRDIAIAPDGSLLLAGAMALAGSNAADVLRYDGINWSGFGPSPFLGFGANAVLQQANGTVYAGGLGFVRWSGTSWTLLSTVPSGVTATCNALAEFPNGDLAVGGDLQQIPGGARPGVMRWNGSSWSSFGAGLSSVVASSQPIVNAIEVRGDGVMFVVGMASLQTPFVARFDGTSWQALPAPTSGTLLAAELLPTGELVVGGQFAAIGGVGASSLARWNGAAWNAVGDGVRMLDGSPGTVMSLHFSRLGELHVGGNFQRSNGQVSVNFARVRSLCAAQVQSFGGGCNGSNGTMALRDRSGAWLGSVARSTASGVPLGGLAIDVLGVAPVFAPLPLASAGCTLWVSPDVLGLVLPTNGAAELSLPIPSTLSLLGQTYYQQAVGVELVGGAIASFVSSNRLQRTIGAF